MTPAAILDFNPAGYTDDRPAPLDHYNEDDLLSNAQKQATSFLSKKGGGGGGGGGFLIAAYVHQHRFYTAANGQQPLKSSLLSHSYLF